MQRYTKDMHLQKILTIPAKIVLIYAIIIPGNFNANPLPRDLIVPSLGTGILAVIALRTAPNTGEKTIACRGLALSITAACVTFNNSLTARDPLIHETATMIWLNSLLGTYYYLA